MEISIDARPTCPTVACSAQMLSAAPTPTCTYGHAHTGTDVCMYYPNAHGDIHNYEKGMGIGGWGGCYQYVHSYACM